MAVSPQSRLGLQWLSVAANPAAANVAATPATSMSAVGAAIDSVQLGSVAGSERGGRTKMDEHPWVRTAQAAANAVI